MNVQKMLRFDIEELDALLLAQRENGVLSKQYRNRYTATPKVKYHSELQKVKAE